ncbi:MAG: glycosyltransferase family 4 protein [Flavobacteriales bacterium]|nr:MAG: glycosyltransferase family 4 protein [Flavobacteriales bacterium]
MKVLFLTQYFPPEVGAPQNRLFASACALRKSGAEVTVLTAMPNYPEMRVHDGYRGKWKMEEERDGLRVIRAWIHVPSGRSVMARLLNYFSFVFSSLLVGLFNLKRSDVLLVESPPLFLGITAMLLARAKGAKLVFNVSDLWPESAVQLGLVTNRTMIRLSTWLEMKCYRSSALITGQTQGIVSDIQRRCPGKRVVWIPNGVDFAAMESYSRAPLDRSRLDALGIRPGDLVFAYAGIIGHAQGLEVIVRAAEILRLDRAHFLLIGAGPELRKLKDMAASMGAGNVHFIDKMPRPELIGLLRCTSGVVVPLRKNDLFKGAIPSKIFEALALGKPLLLGVEGEAKQLFIDDGGAGLAFVPEDAENLAMQVRRYAVEPHLLEQHGSSGSRYARARFDREVISARLWEELKAIARQ